jgi:hypothetical protein
MNNQLIKKTKSVREVVAAGTPGAPATTAYVGEHWYGYIPAAWFRNAGGLSALYNANPGALSIGTQGVSPFGPGAGVSPFTPGAGSSPFGGSASASGALTQGELAAGQAGTVVGTGWSTTTTYSVPAFSSPAPASAGNAIVTFDPPYQVGSAGYPAFPKQWGLLIRHPMAYPAQPATSPTYRTKSDPNPGWNSGARSIKSIAGDGYFEFKVPATLTGVIVGFASSDPDGGFENIQHAYYVGHGGVAIYESGIPIGSFGAAGDGTTFRITRDTGIVTYSVNDTDVHTSSTPSNGEVFVDASLYVAGDSIYDPVLVDLYSGAGAASLPAIAGVAGAAYSIGRANLVHLTGSASGRRTGSYTPLTPPKPSYSAGAGDVGFLWGSATGLTGEIGTGSASFKALKGKGANGPYADGDSVLPALVSGDNYSLTSNTEASITEMCVGFDLVFGVAEIVVLMDSAGVVTGVMAVDLVRDAAARSSATASATYDLDQILSAIAMSLATASAGAPVWDQPAAAWVVNYDTSASSLYENFSFNSYAKVGEKYFGCTADGIYLLEGDDDDGAPVHASINLGKSTLGTPLQKRMADCYLGVSSADTMYLKLTVDGTPYTYVARRSGEAMQAQRVDIGKGLKANYFTFEIYNHDGCDFELDKVEFRLAELTRRI